MWPLAEGSAVKKKFDEIFGQNRDVKWVPLLMLVRIADPFVLQSPPPSSFYLSLLSRARLRSGKSTSFQQRDLLSARHPNTAEYRRFSSVLRLAVLGGGGTVYSIKSSERHMYTLDTLCTQYRGM